MGKFLNKRISANRRNVEWFAMNEVNEENERPLPEIEEFNLDNLVEEWKRNSSEEQLKHAETFDEVVGEVFMLPKIPQEYHDVVPFSEIYSIYERTLKAGEGEQYFFDLLNLYYHGNK